MPVGRLLLRWIPATALTLFFGAWAAQLATLGAINLLHLVAAGRLGEGVIQLAASLGWAVCGLIVGAAQAWAARMTLPVRIEWIVVTTCAFVAGALLPELLRVHAAVALESLSWGVVVGLSQGALLTRPSRAMLWTVATFAGFAVDVATAEYGQMKRRMMAGVPDGFWFSFWVYAPVVASVLFVGLFTGVALLVVRDDLEKRTGSPMRRRLVLIAALVTFALIILNAVRPTIGGGV